MSNAADAVFLEQHGLNAEDVEIPEGVPEPTLWRVLVMPVQPKAATASGIILTAQSQDAESHLQFIGRVVKLGPLAGKSEKFLLPDDLRPMGEIGARCVWDVKEGDWVIYGRYAGQRCEYRGVRLLLLNDDEILAKAQSPEGFRIYA